MSRLTQPGVRPGSCRTWPRRAVIAFVRVYRLLLSPWLGNACRFEPTCSVYAIGARDRPHCPLSSMVRRRP